MVRLSPRVIDLKNVFVPIIKLVVAGSVPLRGGNELGTRL